MKKILGILLVTGLGLSSCVKSSTTSSPTGSMTATAAGTSFSSANCYESSTAAYYTITGQATNATISINIKSNNITTGTYTFDSTLTNNIAAYTANGGVAKNAKSGSVTITTINVGASFIGTFNFVCTDGTIVSGGTFTAVI